MGTGPVVIPYRRRRAAAHFTTFSVSVPAGPLVRSDVSHPWRACMCLRRMLSAEREMSMKKLAALFEVFVTVSVLAYFAYATFVTVYPVA